MITSLMIAGTIIATVGGTLLVGFLIGGLIGNATGAIADDAASTDTTSVSCNEAQQNLTSIDQQIAALREEIEEASRIADQWSIIGVYLSGVSIVAFGVAVIAGMSAIVSGPAGALPGFVAVSALVASGAFAFAASVAFGYSAAWREKARLLTEQLNSLADDRSNAQADVNRLCGTGVPAVVEEPVHDLGLID